VCAARYVSSARPAVKRLSTLHWTAFSETAESWPAFSGKQPGEVVSPGAQTRRIGLERRAKPGVAIDGHPRRRPTSPSPSARRSGARERSAAGAGRPRTHPRVWLLVPGSQEAFVARVVIAMARQTAFAAVCGRGRFWRCAFDMTAGRRAKRTCDHHRDGRGQARSIRAQRQGRLCRLEVLEGKEDFQTTNSAAANPR
jgi:hypothetical protein